jgi:hypothetical protein
MGATTTPASSAMPMTTTAKWTHWTATRASKDFLNGMTEAQWQMQRALGQFPELPTNQKIKALPADHMSISFGETYATNAFAFVKPRQDGRPHFFP